MTPPAEASSEMQHYVIDHGVICHTPDPTKAHDAARLPGYGGASGIVIQRSLGRLGAQAGEDMSRAPKVYIDTDPATGARGPVLDLATADPVALDAIGQQSAELRRSQGGKVAAAYSGKMLKELALQQQAQEPAIAVSESSVPKAAVVQSAPGLFRTNSSSIRAGGIREQVSQSVPDEPVMEVIFDLGDRHGEMSAFYHQVLLQARHLVFVYDNRHKGVKYLAPVSPDRINPSEDDLLFFSVPSLGEMFGGIMLAHIVFQHWTLGVVEITARQQIG